ncbi:hypothetical protein GLOTRDRAFT_97268, partial [Gloeophyllum trabeum ATCC 11539]
MSVVTRLPAPLSGSTSSGTAQDSSLGTSTARDKRKSAPNAGAPKPKPKKRRLLLKNPYDTATTAPPAESSNTNTPLADDVETHDIDSGDRGQRDSRRIVDETGQRDGESQHEDNDNVRRAFVHADDDNVGGESGHAGSGSGRDESAGAGGEDGGSESAPGNNGEGGQDCDSQEGGESAQQDRSCEDRAAEGGGGSVLQDASEMRCVDSTGGGQQSEGEPGVGGRCPDGPKGKRQRGKLVELPKEVKTGR